MECYLLNDINSAYWIIPGIDLIPELMPNSYVSPYVAEPIPSLVADVYVSSHFAEPIPSPAADAYVTSYAC